MTPEAWIEAGTTILAEENVRGVQIPALCERLGVTKGSFYWHFGALGDLLRRLLEHWRRRATLDLIGRLSGTAMGGASILRALLVLPRRSRSRQAAALEASIRDWARRDAEAARAVREVDAVRLKFFEQMFRARGFDRTEATARAYLAYCVMMGDSVLHPTLAEAVPDQIYLETAVRVLGLAAEPGPAARP
ncbi:TetR/AcrR family transcriptional regulator [Rhodovastum atsumiense]|uniref:TetR/AcrR family transcriptional regulator n=1 Tax=Rhodovastum atsumiense TaxID=504468 RepID=A0A5M6ILS5_9PROT|nr:TetR/AcrR family transcriptional regulator [Rhodovastum atsumiense]